MNIGFIGFGLIGGSIAKALRQIPDLSLNIRVYDTDAAIRKLKAQITPKESVIDSFVDDFDEQLSDCDLIFLCAPVHRNMEYLYRLKSIIRPGCLITDVGSVKSPMHQTIDTLGLNANFIGGHPMAGSEKSGYENSNDRLLENAYYILTPTKETTAESLELLQKLIIDMKAIPLVLSCEEHDAITAAISHVPHIIAAQLVNLVRTHDDETEKMRMLAAGGFKDITRIASSSPAMWESICLSNATSIKESLLSLIDSLNEVVTAIDTKNSEFLYDMFEKAGIYREQIPNRKGLMNRFFEIFLDITDEPGAIAIIATLLGSNGISIKNIGIIHNREFEQGVLRIELYEEAAMERAIIILKSHNYTIHQR